MVSSLYVTALSMVGFVAASAALFAFNLDSGEGGFSSLASIWAVSVSPLIPVFAALAGMEVWSDDFKTGRIDLLLSSPVRERDFVKGKFLGVWTLALIALFVSLASTLVFLNVYAPDFFKSLSLWGFIPGFFLLAVQSALWSAVAVAASALFRNAAGAAATTVLLLVGVPRGLWLAFSHWARDGRIALCEFPLDAHAFDFASGLIGIGTVLSYVILTVFALFAAARFILYRRFPGRRMRLMRFSASLSVFFGLVFSVLAVSLCSRMDISLDMPVVGSGNTRFSPRTREVLSQAQGSISITVFLERSDPQFRHVSHFLRSLKREADATGGVLLELKYVDPVLDTGEALRLVRAGVGKGSIVFERDEHIAHTLKISDGYGERECIAFIERMAVPFLRNVIYWTTGHDEASFSDYALDGMSDIARDIALNGYENKSFSLAGAESQIGPDCALVVIAAPRTDFSAKEVDALAAYLEGRGETDGGRLLVLADGAVGRGLENLLSRWGVRIGAAGPVHAPTISGSDVVVGDFSPDHAVSRPFKGCQVVLEKPVRLAASSAATEGTAGADRKKYSELFGAGGACFAAAVERGSAGEDLAIRPTRLIAVGDAGFVMNAKLRSYANANRDFLLNAVKYLSGRDALTMSGTEANRLVTGMNRTDRIRFVLSGAVAFPLAFFAAYAFFIGRRRRRQ